MREIKFRFWDNLEERMIQPSEKIFMNLFGKISVEDDDGDVFFIKDTEIEIMQFTGLQDVTGKDIYEGDIQTSPHGNKEIYFSQGIFWAGIKVGEKYYYESPLKTWCDTCKVIGNIYENPELLEQGRVAPLESEPMSR